MRYEQLFHADPCNKFVEYLHYALTLKVAYFYSAANRIQLSEWRTNQDLHPTQDVPASILEREADSQDCSLL